LALKFSEYLALLRVAHISPPADISAYFRQLQTNKRRHEFCLAMMEHYRTLIWRGLDEHKAYLLALPTRAMFLRYGHIKADERIRLAAVQWFQSATFKDLKENENLYDRWAKTYADAMQAEVLP
jgi:hypothetical protein